MAEIASFALAVYTPFTYLAYVFTKKTYYANMIMKLYSQKTLDQQTTVRKDTHDEKMKRIAVNRDAEEVLKCRLAHNLKKEGRIDEEDIKTMLVRIFLHRENFKW